MKTKLSADRTLGDIDYILKVTLADQTLRFTGQGLKFRFNPLHPAGWKKISTAQKYATLASSLWSENWGETILEVAVCERMSTFRCLSSIAISKQNSEVAKEQDHETD